VAAVRPLAPVGSAWLRLFSREPSLAGRAGKATLPIDCRRVVSLAMRFLVPAALSLRCPERVGLAASVTRDSACGSCQRLEP
jgi:hypothetical protein